MNARTRITAAVAYLALVLGVCAVRADARTVRAFAAPGVWGAWTTLAAHIGPVTYVISAVPEGSTTIIGELKYVGADGRWRVDDFYETATISTGNAVAEVYIRFAGHPFGSAVRVDIVP